MIHLAFCKRDDSIRETWRYLLVFIEHVGRWERRAPFGKAGHNRIRFVAASFKGFYQDFFRNLVLKDLVPLRYHLPQVQHWRKGPGVPLLHQPCFFAVRGESIGLVVAASASVFKNATCMSEATFSQSL